MKPSYIRRELRDLLTEAEKLEGDLARHQLDWAEWSARGREDGPPDWLIDKDDELVKPFEHLATSIYLSTVALLDAEGMLAYLKQFYLRFGENFDSSKAASEFDVDHYWPGDPYNLFLSRFRQFAAPLEVIGGSDRYLNYQGSSIWRPFLRTLLQLFTSPGGRQTPRLTYTNRYEMY